MNELEIKKKLEETLLKGDVEGWNKWVQQTRAKYPNTKIPITDIVINTDEKDKDFANIDFLGKPPIDFSSCIFTNCTFKNIVFSSGTNFQYSEFKDSKMDGCLLSCATFTGFKEDEKSSFFKNKYIDCSIPDSTGQPDTKNKSLVSDGKMYHALKGINCDNLADKALYKNKAADIKWMNLPPLGKFFFNLTAPANSIDVLNWGLGYGIHASQYGDRIVNCILPGLVSPPSTAGLKFHNTIIDATILTPNTSILNIAMLGGGYITPDKNFAINLGVGNFIGSVGQNFKVDETHNEEIGSPYKAFNLGARFEAQWKVSRTIELDAKGSTRLTNLDGDTKQYNKYYSATPHTVEVFSKPPMGIQLSAKLNIPLHYKKKKEADDSHLPLQLQFGYNYSFGGELKYTDPSLNFEEHRRINETGFFATVNLAMSPEYAKNNKKKTFVMLD